MERYDRQIKFNGIGVEGQKKICDAVVGIIGAGALGTHLADQVVRSGVRKLVIVDRDYVELSNLQRQTGFKQSDAEDMVPKVAALKRELSSIRTDLDIEIHLSHCDASLLETAFLQCDILLDATDNFETRQIINDFAYQHNKPWVYGACVESTYSACAFIPGKTPCFNCMMGALPAMNRTCDTVGVISPAVTIAVSYQMTYCLKVLAGQEFESKLIFGDIWTGEHTSLKFDLLHRPNCPTCGDHPKYLYLKQRNIDAMLCGRDTIQMMTPFSESEVKQKLESHGIQFHETPYFLRFKFKDKRMILFNGGRLLIHDVKTMNEGRSVYHQLFG